MSDDGGILSRFTSLISESPIVYRGKKATADTAVVAKKLLKSTGKAAWVLGTTFLMLVVPLIIEMDRDQQLTDLELQKASLLGGKPPNPKKLIPEGGDVVVTMIQVRLVQWGVLLEECFLGQ